MNVRESLLGRRVYRVVVGGLALWGAGFALVVYTPIANLLAAPLFRMTSSPAHADVIVVLSGGRYLDGSLNEAALERTVTGVRLYRQGLAPLLVFTGGPCCGQSASAAMADLATALGVPSSAILLEEQSRRTHESAVYTAALLRTTKIQSVILVTSALHLMRSERTFRASGVSVYPVRASEKDLRLVSSAAERIALLDDAVHEYVGLAFYRVRGWI